MAEYKFGDGMKKIFLAGVGAIALSAEKGSELIGELVKNLSENFRCTHSAIPWRSVARMRELLAHRYGVLDYEQMWDTSHDSVAKLKQYLLDMNRKTPLEL